MDRTENALEAQGYVLKSSNTAPEPICQQVPASFDTQEDLCDWRPDTIEAP